MVSLFALPLWLNLFCLAAALFHKLLDLGLHVAFHALGAIAMCGCGIGAFGNVDLNRLSGPLFVPDLLAVCTNREQTLQLLHLILKRENSLGDV